MVIKFVEYFFLGGVSRGDIFVIQFTFMTLSNYIYF